MICAPAAAPGARIDQRAGLPNGSTSNYFRTLAALLAGVVEAIAEREMPSVHADVVPGSAAELVDSLCGGIEYLTGPRRTLTTARLVLFVEAGHNADLRTALERGRDDSGRRLQFMQTIVSRARAHIRVRLFWPVPRPSPVPA